jgi:peptidoglycan-associated lipoprotein
MRKRLVGMLLMLFCLTIVAGGCTKKQMLKEDDTLAQSPALSSQTATSTPAATPVAQEPVVKDDALTESATAVEPFETIYFDVDSYVLRQDARDALDNNAQWLLKKSTGTVRLEGNCDQRGSDEYNLALGEKRAKAAKSYLVTLGVPADRLNTISYGKEKPLDTGHNEDAWAKNRRVDFVIVK